MKRLGIVFLTLCWALIDAATIKMPKVELQIADTTSFGCTALNFAVLRYGEADGSAGVTRCDGANALRGLEAGKFQLILIDEAAIPASFQGKKIPAFCDVLIAYVNLYNRVKDVPKAKLAAAWNSVRPVWSMFGGDASDIHRYAIVEGRPGGSAVADMLKLRTSAMGITWLNSTSEALLFANRDVAALVLGRYQEEYPAESVRPLAVDGVFPDAKNIFGGKYPLMRRYVWVLPVSEGEKLKRFFLYLSDDTFHRSLLEEDLLPEKSGNNI